MSENPSGASDLVPSRVQEGTVLDEEEPAPKQRPFSAFPGDPDYIGDDIFDVGDVLGDVTDASEKKRQHLRRALLNRRTQDGRLLKDDWNPREYALGFSRTSVPPGTTARVVLRPQVIFRPERLIIPSNIAFNFTVVNISVGHTDILGSPEELPGVIFSESSLGVRLRSPTATPATDIAVTVRNQSAAAVTFQAAIVGPQII